MRMIDADKLIKELKDLYFQADQGNKNMHFSMADIIIVIDTMPTIDAENLKEKGATK